MNEPKSIYEEVMGEDFRKLHPKIQERFGFSSRSGRSSVGTGVMERVWHGAPYTLPFLWIGTWRNIMFPEWGTNVPFKIENWAYIDSHGRETVTWLRTFQLGHRRRFDAYMVRDPSRNIIVDYLGDHQHLAVDIHLSVAPNGGLRLKSGEQRFYEGSIAFRFPMFFSGIADVCEWYDDALEKYQIEVIVSNRLWGKLFGYRGSFDVSWIDSPSEPSHSVRPRREEDRF